jgi:hypothetical protein
MVLIAKLFKGVKKNSEIKMITENHKTTLSHFGFKFGKNGAHSSRSMMLEELRALFLAAPVSAILEQYQEEIVTHNCLNKSTENSRRLTFRHLKDLYGLDTRLPLFRVLRLLWDIEPAAQSVLALQLAYARDPLFRISSDYILSHNAGELIYREEIETLLSKDDPTRFSPASLKSFSININGSWTQAGYLNGKVKKIRQSPAISPINVTYALFQGYLCGLSGERLFNSAWTKLLDVPLIDLQTLARAASYRGLIDYKESGGVVDIRCSNYLNSDEILLIQTLYQEIL